jgi:HD-GYP domain-containing protein (c-di-GMP phosphodiesterase class II)
MLRDFVINIFSSGKSLTYEKYKEERIQEHGISDYLLKYFLLNFIHVFGSIILISFVFINVSRNAYFDAFACSFLAIVIIADFFIARTNVSQVVPTVISSIFYGLFCILVIWNGDAHGAGFLFIFIYPMLTIILTGMVRGIILSAALLVIVSIEFFVPGASHFEYPLDVSLRMIAVYILIFGTTMVFETSRKNKDRINKKLLEKINGINENLHSIVEERTRKIVKLQNSILKTMSNLVEYRDFVTGEHVERTQYGVNLLLEELKKSKIFAEKIKDWDTNLILQSVQLHDVGKIAISDLILNKPDKLTEEEYKKMKDHTLYGFKIIERIEADSGESELLNHAKLFALTHHEKWDGTGYPNGLYGNNIPLQGRIMAIADVYDALISERPYKKAFSREEAFRIITEGKGTQFDPLLIDLFIEIFNKL